MNPPVGMTSYQIHIVATRIAADTHNLIRWIERRYPYAEIVEMIEKEIKEINER